MTRLKTHKYAKGFEILRRIEHVRAQRRAMLEVLEELVRYESPRLDPALLETLARHLQDRFEAVGAETTLLGNPGGGSDGNFAAALGVPTLDRLGAVGEGAHAPRV